MKQERYEEILNRLKTLIEGSVFEGHVYSVGGCERDVKLGKPIKDIDLVVDIPNGGIMLAEWLWENNNTMWAPVIYQNFGTAMFTLKEFGDVELEAVQTRKEAYRDINSRDPETAFGTIHDDCTRRDFTVNAFYRNISTGESIDFNGNSEADLKNKIIRTCGDPEIIFNEDPLRILRMVRFSSRLGFEIEEKTFECARKYVDRLSIISRERVHDEFMKMCDVKDFNQFFVAISLIWDIRAFKYIIPYLHKLNHLDKFNLKDRLADFWFYNVFPKPSELFAAMLYKDPDAEEEMRELKCCNDFIKEVMFYINTAKEYRKIFEGEWYEENEEFIFRKFMYHCGSSRKLQVVLSMDEHLYDYFFDFYYGEECNMFREYENANLMFYTYKLPVDGNDVMEVLGIGPSEKVKIALDRLLDFVFANPDHSDRDNLMRYLEQIIKKDI